MCVCVLCVNSRQDMNFIICFISFHIWSSKFIIFQSYQSIPKKIGCRKKNENGQKTTMMMMMKININILANILLWKKIPIQVLILKIFFLFIFSFESNRIEWMDDNWNSWCLIIIILFLLLREEKKFNHHRWFSQQQQKTNQTEMKLNEKKEKISCLNEDNDLRLMFFFLFFCLMINQWTRYRIIAITTTTITATAITINIHIIKNKLNWNSIQENQKKKRSSD